MRWESGKSARGGGSFLPFLSNAKTHRRSRFPSPFPRPRRAEAFDWVLALEDDRQEAGRFIAGDLPVREEREIGGSPFTRRAFSLPFVPAAGCHTLHVIPSSGDPGLSGDMRLIVTPSTCCHPPVLEGNGRTWGPAFQLYGVRSRRNWGIGDFGDLGNAAAFWGRQGAGIVGLNPLHSLFPHAPAHASPYSPSSRLFLNIWYIDVQAIPEFAECEAARRLVNNQAFQTRLSDLRNLDLVDYERVAAAKREVLKVLFAYFRKTHLRWDDARGRAFRNFRHSQRKSLRSHALYEALQEHFHEKDPSVSGWPDWPAEYRNPDSPRSRRSPRGIRTAWSSTSISSGRPTFSSARRPAGPGTLGWLSASTAISP